MHTEEITRREVSPSLLSIDELLISCLHKDGTNVTRM